MTLTDSPTGTFNHKQHDDLFQGRSIREFDTADNINNVMHMIMPTVMRFQDQVYKYMCAGIKRGIVTISSRNSTEVELALV